MIPNLKEKLAQISVENNDIPAEQGTLDLECSEYTYEFDMDYAVGDTQISDSIAIDYNNLSALCMEGFEHELTPDDIIYFDTETTGLGSGVSTVAFLIGVGYYENEKFVVKQFLMNDYHQESSMLESLNNILLSKKAVISFNGKAFDRHIVNSRSIMNRLIRPLEDMIHLDIMHASRRLFARRLHSCSMGNLEKQILDIHRVDDIPGALIPDVFSDYIKYKDSTMLKKVIDHNKLDVVNMTGIAVKLCNAFNNPHYLEHKKDIFSQGLIFEKLHLVDRAKICYNMLGVHKGGMMHLAKIAKSQKDFVTSAAIYSELTIIDSLNISHNIELCKIYEHRTKELDKALAQVNNAIMTKLSLTQLGYECNPDDLENRKKRIISKMQSKRKDDK